MSRLNFQEKKVWLAINLCYFIFSSFILFYFDGIGSEADSINHFLFAKYAPVYPQLYLDHWAKPLFTLLASPFAQFGFTGIKVFNAILVFFNFNLLYLIAKQLGLSRPYLPPVFYALFPLTFITTYTGLTEPLCAFFILVALVLNNKNRHLAAAVIISFTPFIRSEGLILIGVWGLYLVYQKQFKLLPLLMLGHILFALAGAIYHESFFWVFNKIPYSSLDSPYGEGRWYHFLDKTTNMIGIPLYIMLGLGLLSTVKIKLLKQKNILLLISLLLAFYLAHSIFWTFGIFNSMGLKRVFAAISPLIAISCLMGFNFFTNWFKGVYQKAVPTVFLLYILVFPFTSNPAAVEWPEDLQLTKKQQVGLQLTQFYEKGNWESKRLVYADPYISLVLDRRPFFNDMTMELRTENLTNLEAGDIIIWDNWHAPYDNHLTLDQLERKKGIELIGSLKNDTTTYFSIYESSD